MRSPFEEPWATTRPYRGRRCCARLRPV